MALTLIAASAGTAGVAVALLAVLGLLAMPSPLARLHFLTPAATITPVLLGLAAAAHQSFGSGAVKPALVAVLMVVTAPVLTHATGRALSEDRR